MRKPTTVDQLQMKIRNLTLKYPWIKILYDAHYEELCEIVDLIHSEGYQLGYDEGYTDGGYDQKAEVYK